MRRGGRDPTAPGTVRAAHERIWSWSVAAALLLIAGAAVACYFNALHAPFELDDETAITDNPFVCRCRGWLCVRELWRWSPFRLVTNLTFAANCAAGGLRVTGYHAVNLAIHAGAAGVLCWLVLLLQRAPALRGRPRPGRLGAIPGEIGLATFAALLFAVHPIQTEAVTYVVQRAAALTGLLYLLALALYARAALLRLDDAAHTRGRRLLLLGGCAAAFVLAMMTKENAATLPAAILLLEVGFFAPRAGDGSGRGAFSRRVVVLAALFTVTGMVAAAGFVALSGGIAGAQRYLTTPAPLPRAEYLFTEVNVVRTYLRLLVLPVEQNLDYDYPLTTTPLDLPTLLSALLLVTLLVLAARQWRRRPLIGFGIAFFFLALSVESTIIPLPDVIFEHRLYLPSAGAAMAVAAAAWAGLDRLAAPGARRWRGWYVAAMAAAVVAFGAGTIARNAVWTDAVRLWTDVVQKSPDKARAHHNLARAEQLAGNLQAAAAEYRTAAALDPGRPKTWNNLGAVEQRLGHLRVAEAAFRQALALDPRFADSYINLAFLYQQMDRLDDAEKALHEAWPLAPFNSQILRGSGKLALRRGALRQAEYYYALALRVDPESAESHNELGVVYYAEKRYDQAEAEYRRALEIDPHSADAYTNLGNVLVRKDALPAAEAAYRHALEFDPRQANARFNLGVVCAATGRWQAAAEAYRAVLEMQPDSARAREQLAVAEQHLRTAPSAAP